MISLLKTYMLMLIKYKKVIENNWPKVIFWRQTYLKVFELTEASKTNKSCDAK